MANEQDLRYKKQEHGGGGKPLWASSSPLLGPHRIPLLQLLMCPPISDQMKARGEMGPIF